jgi:phosphoserine phosphatase
VDKSSGYRTRCLLTIPLVDFEDQLIGVAQVLNKSAETGGVFTPDDEQMAVLIATQAAIAIKRAALLEAEREKERLEADLQVARVTAPASARFGQTIEVEYVI